MESPTIDLSVILRELDAAIAEAEQHERDAALNLADLRGQRRGVLLVLERGQRPRVGPAISLPEETRDNGILTEGQEG